MLDKGQNGMFRAYFPDLGEDPSDAKPVKDAIIPLDAAELAAANRCHRDAEWGTHIVCVLGGETAETYEVTFESVPYFHASLKKPCKGPPQ